MGIQINDHLQAGNHYLNKTGILSILICDSDDKVCVIENGNSKIIEKKAFLSFYTAKTPVRTWPDKPDHKKYYGANYCGGTKYLYCNNKNDFISKEGNSICREWETVSQYFLGNGNISKTLNNYQIVEFETVIEMVHWFHDS